MVDARRRSKHRPVLQLAEDVLEALVRRQGYVLCVLVADGAEMPMHFANRNDGAAQPAG